MNRLLVGRVLSLGLLVVLVVLALSACGGGEKKAKARPPTRGTESAAPRNVPLGGVQALTLLQGRQGMVKHTPRIFRRLADHSGTDGGARFR
jgi:hypothetical protein